MLEKESASGAIAKRVERQQMITKPVPATSEATTVSSVKKKRASDYSSCQQPMKGHKSVKDCPKNLQRIWGFTAIVYAEFTVNSYIGATLQY